MSTESHWQMDFSTWASVAVTSALTSHWRLDSPTAQPLLCMRRTKLQCCQGHGFLELLWLSVGHADLPTRRTKTTRALPGRGCPCSCHSVMRSGTDTQPCAPSVLATDMTELHEVQTTDCVPVCAHAVLYAAAQVSE